MIGARIVVTALLGAAIAQAPAPPAEGSVVHVSVATSSGAPVADLQTSDFSVSVGGRQVAHRVVDDDKSPAFIVLIDNSASMPLSDRHMARLVLGGLVQRLTVRDRAFVAPVTDARNLDAALIDKASNPTGLLAKAQSSPTEPSPLWDSLVGVSEWAKARSAGPAAVLLITDGRATGNHCSVNDAVAAVLGVHATVSVLSAAAPTEVRREGTSAVAVDPNQILRQVAEATGGHFIAGAFARMPPAFDRLSRLDAEIDRDRDLVRQWVQHTRARYTLAIEVPAGMAGKQVEVRVRRPDVAVRASRFAHVGADSTTCLPAKAVTALHAPAVVAR